MTTRKNIEIMNACFIVAIIHTTLYCYLPKSVIICQIRRSFYNIIVNVLSVETLALAHFIMTSVQMIVLVLKRDILNKFKDLTSKALCLTT